MKPRQEKKINELTDKLNKFIEDMNQKREITITNGRKALKDGSTTNLNYWVVQYKLTQEYEKQAKETLGQLEIAKYSSEIGQSVKEFFDCMGNMAKQLSKVFGYTSLKEIEKNFDKNIDKYSANKDNIQDMIEETTDRFKEIQEGFATSGNPIEINDEERTKIVKIFEDNKSNKNNDDILKRLFG